MPIRVSAVVIRDDHGRVLTVRKRGTTRFMFPGGKPEPGETAAQTAVRECAEEIGVQLDPAELTLLGTFGAAAANEAGEEVLATVFEHGTTPAAAAAAEIEELRWTAIESHSDDLAPLLVDHVFPALRTASEPVPQTNQIRRPDMFDLGPAATRMRDLVIHTTDDQLDLPTPCSDWSVAQLLTHIHQFAEVFTQNARKLSPRPPQQLLDDWRTAIPTQLDQLAAAWIDENAWQGRVSAGGIEMDASDNAVVAIEELTVHGWDLARATGQQLRVDDADLDQVDNFLKRFSAGPNEGPFGPTVAVSDDASRLDHVVAGTGRDPGWSPNG